MRADRVVLRAILTTLLCIVVLFGVMFLLLYAVFPATLMGLTYDLGMEESSVKHASRAYNRTDDVYYAAFAFETSIEIQDVEMIEKYGVLLINDDEFSQYCKTRNDKIAQDNENASNENKIGITYEQYAYGQVTISQYSQGKKESALTMAFSGLNGGFPVNNPVAILYLTALKAGDAETVSKIETKIVELSLSEQEHWKEIQALKTN